MFLLNRFSFVSHGGRWKKVERVGLYWGWERVLSTVLRLSREGWERESSL